MQSFRLLAKAAPVAFAAIVTGMGMAAPLAQANPHEVQSFQPLGDPAGCSHSVSADGHWFSATCSQPGAHGYFVTATACNEGGCRGISSNPVSIGTGVSLNSSAFFTGDYGVTYF
jgi:hypothetical protein